MGKANWREIGVGLVVPVVVLAVWQLAATLGWVNENVLPSPLAVVRKWIAYLLPLADRAPGEAWWKWVLSGELIVDSLGSMYRVQGRNHVDTEEKRENDSCAFTGRGPWSIARRRR